MDTVKGVLAILTLLLGALSFLLFIQLSATNAQLSQATELSANTLKLLKGQSATNCGTVSNDFQKINDCIKPLLLTNDFKEDTFAQPDLKKATTGYLVIRNDNKKTYDGTRFTFYKDNILTQTGCLISGDISYKETCRFDFAEYCEAGHKLEVYYNMSATNETAQIFLKNCKGTLY